MLMVWTGFGLLHLPWLPQIAPSPAVAAQSEMGQGDQPPWPHEISDLAPDPAIVFGRLPNGFGYVLMNNQRPKNRVSVHLYVRAGSLNETNEQRGLAHYLEHMLFNGSTHFPPGDLVRYFQSIGMQFGNDANAYTGFDETVYDVILPLGDEENLKKGLLVMRDYAMGALLLEEEVKREKGVILAEMRSRDSTAFRTFEATLKFELPEFLASERLPIGKAETIRNADRAILKDYYDSWYRPDNTVLVMVGDFSIPVAKSLVEAQFNDFKSRAPIPALPELGTISHQGLKVFFHHEPEAGGTTVSIEVVRAHNPAPDSLDRQRQQLIADLADRILQNRLDARLKAPDAPFTAATVGSGVYLNHIRYAEISADSSAGNWRQTLTALEQELRRARLYGFTEPELARVKKDFQKMLTNAVREASTRNSTSIARSIIRQLNRNRVVQSPQQKKDNLAPLVTATTLDDVQEAFADNWPDDHRLVLVTGDADLGSKAPGRPEAVIRGAFLASAGTVVERPEVAAVARFPYLPIPDASGEIASREDIDDLGIIRIRFGNGVRLSLKRTDYKTNEVMANLIFGNGRSSEPQAIPGLSLLAEDAINESGFDSLDTTQLERALAGKSTYVDFRIRETHFNLSAETVPDEVELMFQLIVAHLTDPGFRDDAMELVRERLRQDYQSLSRSVDGLMRIDGLRFLAGGDSRFGMPDFKQIQAIGLEDIRRWIAPQLAEAPLELSIVGDFDEKAVIELAGRYLGTLPDRSGSAENARTDMPTVPTGAVKRLSVDTQIPKAMVVAAWQTDDFWDIGRTRRLSVLADIFSERLRQRIREKLGASYSPFAFNRASRAYMGYGIFQAYVSVAPDQADTVLEEVRTIAESLAREGTTTDELARAIDPILTSIRELRQTNGYWLNSVMTGLARHPQQIEWARSFLADYSAVTVDELNRLAATYLTDARAAAIIIQPNHSTDA
ncbi:MAG: insulinase family protein [Desulfosarcina sp.]